MLKLVASKAAWVGRTASAAFGLALVVVSVLVVAEAAFGNDGDFFKVGRTNLASAVSVLSKSGTGPALNLQVGSGAPLAVNSSSKVVKLNADKLDGKDADAFAQANGTLPAVRALGTAQTIDTSGGSLLQLPNEDFDQVGTGQSGQLHTTATNNSRFTAPRAGIYRVDAQVGWSLNSSGTTSGIRGAYFKKNNNGSCNDGVVATVNAFDRVDAQEGGQTFNHLGTLLALNRSDYVEMCVYQSDGAPLSIYPHGTFVEMHYVSPR